ncbi:hypothetical protein NPIL_2841 [Nephila pilipes]|uniref:Uncharacterized protein n=1 Tax=Nephila pilipes TaxID=299642 RepID=A0A8X6NZZ4_NEPPI|nr:hypothetical protein NPIL_2841 [Nephila pilipes]
MSENVEYLNNAAKMYATVIVQIVIRRHAPDWMPEEAVQRDDIVPESIQLKVRQYCEFDSSQNWTLFRQNFDGKPKTKANFTTFCSYMTSILQRQVKRDDLFFINAVKLAEMASYMYCSHCYDAPSIAILYITNILLEKYSHLLQSPY